MARQLNKGLAAVVCFVIVSALAQASWAQRGGGRGIGRLFGGIAKAQLATLDEVQSDLKLTDDQKTQIAEINDKLREDRRGLFGGGFGQFSQIRADMDKLNRAASAEVDAKLDEPQKQRLQEIAIQVNGPAALSDPSVVEQLNLSDEQKKKLEEVQADNSQAVEDAMSDFGDISREERREKFRALSDTANEKLLGVLTDEQKTQFDKMKGQEIDIDPSSLFGRGGGGGGGGGNR
jgi:Spy/CpxP family protein refolding chaperone